MNRKSTLLRIFFSFSAVILFHSLWAQNTYQTGLVWDDELYHEAPLKSALTQRDYVSIPSKASLKKYCPIPQSQGDYSTCVGWSVAYAARTILEAQKRSLSDREEITRNAYSGAYLYRLIQRADDSTCSLGTSIHDALSLMQSRGVLKKEQYDALCPFDTPIPSTFSQEASQNRIMDFQRLFDLEDSYAQRIKRVKKSLAEGNPVIIGMKCPPSLYDAEEYWTPRANERPSYRYTGHAVCVVSYDDERLDGKGAFEIMNSWGLSWGKDGFSWVSYDNFVAYVKYAYEMVPDPRLYPDEQSLEGKIRFIQDSGESMPLARVRQGEVRNWAYYRMQESYASGTRFRIYVENQQPAYVYAFASDQSGEIVPIFPFDPSMSASLNYEESQVALPDERHYIQLDDQTGVDYLLILYSKYALKPKQVQNKLKQARGDFPSKVEKGLASFFEQNARFTNSLVGFQSDILTSGVVGILLEIPHKP